jgi:hypothetical protein
MEYRSEGEAAYIFVKDEQGRVREMIYDVGLFKLTAKKAKGIKASRLNTPPNKRFNRCAGSKSTMPACPSRSLTTFRAPA